MIKKTGLLMMLMPKLTVSERGPERKRENEIQYSVVMMKENFELAELFNMFEADVCCKSFKQYAS